MAGNFVNTRYSLGWVLGFREEDPYSSLFFQAKALDESFSYPSLQQLKESFHKISPLVYQKLLAATDEQLEKKFPIGMDVLFFEENILNFAGMSIGREDYLCGQMRLMRKILGYKGMKYDVDENLKY
ncbi:MAG: DinB family protein [Agriterribacter sp.]